MGIRLKKNEYESVIGMLSNYREGNEFEASISPSLLSNSRFNQLLLYLRSTLGECKVFPETLDIMSDSYRVSIAGVDKISAYCKKETVAPEHCTIIEKRRGAQLDIADYHLRLRLASESPVTDKTEKENLIAGLKGEKTYRLKKRFSFTSQDRLFKIDLTAVRESARKHNMLSFAKIQSKCEKYEVEVEYIGKGFKDSKPMIGSLFGTLSELLKVVYDVEILLRNTEKETLLAQYASLVKKEMGIKDISTLLARQPRKFYVAVKPVTLERRHLLADEQINLLGDTEYTCTEKADGERMLVYIADDGKIYMLNSRMEMLGTNMKSIDSWRNSLFDAEYVIQLDKSKALLLFDAYYQGGRLVADQPLLDGSAKLDRVRIIQQFASQFGQTEKIQIRAKEFKAGDMFEAASQILAEVESDAKFGYHVDGLIFTPAKLAVGASSAKDPVSFKGTWRNTLKWKPPQENTIDFLVKSRRVEGSEAVGDCNIVPLVDAPLSEKKLYLYCGHRAGSVTAHDYFMRPAAVRNQREEYIAKLFTPPGAVGHNLATCNITADGSGKFKCTNGDLISDNCIVEMSWDGEQWIPYRVRHDKTEAFRMTKSISNTANDYEIAVSIWLSIMNPVTKEHVTGKETLTKDDVPKDDDRYYARNSERIKSATYPMMTFHNFWVKERHLIGRLGKAGSKSLVDIACGKGGDLSKWINNGFTAVLGIDVVDDNINNPNDGVYTRLYSQSQALTANHKYIFVKLDTSQLYNKKQFEQQSGFNKRLISIIWGTEKPEEQQLKAYFGMALEKFNVVSCQFALHYMFKSDETLNNAISNINMLIKDKGYFIGTCFDGDAVAKLLKDKDSVEGRKDGQMIWSIDKKYDVYDGDTCGQEIDVYIISINKKITEYLVNFGKLTRELEKHKIRLLNAEECAQLGMTSSTGMFDQLYDEMLEKEPNHHLVKIASQMSSCKDEQTLSFMNRWFIFKKDDGMVAEEKPVKKPAKRVVIKEETEEPAKKPTKKKAVVVSDEEAEEPAKKPTKKKAAVVSDDEPAKKPTKKKAVVVSDEEAEEPAKKPAKKKAVVVSDEEPAKKPARKKKVLADE